MIVVMGATGHTGGAVADRLLAAGKPIRVLGRSAERLQPLVKRGATPAVGDATDAAFLTEAFRGAAAVYALVPPDYAQPDPIAYYDRVGAAIETALKRTQVPHVVHLSSLGTELAAGTGIIVGSHRVEQRLKKLDAAVVVLRPGFFFENLYSSLGLIKQQGVNGGATNPDVSLAMIATQDIAAVAAEELTTKRARGTTVRELLGPRDYTMTDVTRILGAKIGKPGLPYVQFPDEGVKAALVQAGFSRGTADAFVEMSHAFNAGIVHSLEGRNAGNTTETTFERFADQLAEAYRNL
jgi:uncharacterized protein YbjT (DUF2867 family)